MKRGEKHFSGTQKRQKRRQKKNEKIKKLVKSVTPDRQPIPPKKELTGT